jgi:transposase
MQARDFRGIGRAAQEELRRRALFLIERQGLSQGRAALLVGVHRQTVNTWVKRHRERGEEGLLDGRRVSPRRGKGILSADEAQQVRTWIIEQTPDQLELPFGLWTSRAVRELIERRFGKRLGLTAVQLYLRRLSTSSTSRRGIGPSGPMGLTPQKPLVRATARQPAAIAAWLETTYPAIAKRARAARAVIYWGDETGISNHQAAQPHDPAAQLARAGARAGDQIGRSYAPKGRTPGSARRLTRRMISAVSNRGLLRFMLYDGALNAAVGPRCGSTLTFWRRLIKDAKRKVVLIVDNLKVHKAGKVLAWVESHAHEIELHYLPAYAPDHNPTEYLNNDLKRQLRQQPQPGSKEELTKRTRSVLRVIQRAPDRIQDYFKPEPVRYAA